MRRISEMESDEIVEFLKNVLAQQSFTEAMLHGVLMSMKINGFNLDNQIVLLVVSNPEEDDTLIDIEGSPVIHHHLAVASNITKQSVLETLFTRIIDATRTNEPERRAQMN